MYFCVSFIVQNNVIDKGKMPKYFTKYVVFFLSNLYSNNKNMREDYHLITTILCIVYTLHSDKGMVYDGGTIKLEHHLKKSIRYQYHHLNYKESLENGLIPKGLKINKRPAIKPVT